MSENIELIRKLCEDWKREALGENGGISIGKSEQFRLINNGIRMHDLNSNELQICCIELTRILLLKGMNTIISEDHQWFWSWIGEIINNRHINYLNDLNEYPIKELFCTCIRSTLAGIEKPPSSKEVALRRFKYRKEHPIEHNLNELYTNSHLILAYLSFPLLESVLKKHCHEYVLLSGKVIKDFDVKRGTGYTKKYITGDSINSIEDLLLLIIQKVGKETLVKNLNSILEHIKGLNEENPNEPCRIIYNWRNSSLHGETSYSTIGGTILNIAIIIFLHSIENEYNQNLPKIKENVSWNIQCNSQAPWIFYPPYF
ncbi:hypothetical protein AXY43_23155 [Clostridium sp. MF28]|uniref:hypothetical protein n=1 Tax=Clostridium TaxID=1485 RepID=UPI000CF9BEEA|nr:MULTISPECIES: hypothetical protein [Clostridium]AVK50680.1 hypothetical protein AXY43_23155 [Clostridium sp. MF28]PSM58991.1 hypothetical protein C4L39_03795 [Clostridium diolis]